MNKRLAGFVLAATFATGAFAAPPGTTIVADGLGFPEGTILADKVLYFVDYQASTVNKLDESSHAVVKKLPGCGANGLVAVGGNLWVACYDSGVIEQISADGSRVGSIDHSRDGKKFIHPNDLVANRRGDVYFTASGDLPGSGKVFFVPKPGDVAQEVASGINNANGIALSPDEKTLYVGESGADRILDYQIGGDGTLHSAHTFADLDSLAPPPSVGRHTPDGIRAGPDGSIYIALFNGGGSWILNSKGALVKTLDVPGEHHSNLAISSDGRVIYVTSISGSSGRIYRLSPLPN